MYQNTFEGKQDIIDVVVVGAGAAGLSAALFLSRARRRIIVYDGGPTRNSTTEQVHEFLGFEGITPAELQARGRAEVVRYGGEIRSEAVLKIESRPDGLFDSAISPMQPPLAPVLGPGSSTICLNRRALRGQCKRIAFRHFFTIIADIKDLESLL